MATFTKIASVTVGASPVATIDFSSIPATYTDLVLKCSIRGSAVALNVPFGVRFNNDSTAVYSYIGLQGSGASAISYSATGLTSFNIGNATGATATANTFGSTDVYIPNYTSSNQKSVSNDDVMENNAATGYITLTAARYTGTAAINRITIADYTGSTSFAQYSTVTLYGIKNS